MALKLEALHRVQAIGGWARLTPPPGGYTRLAAAKTADRDVHYTRVNASSSSTQNVQPNPRKIQGYSVQNSETRKKRTGGGGEGYHFLLGSLNLAQDRFYFSERLFAPPPPPPLSLKKNK